MTPTDLYLDLLAKSLTDTLYAEEPDHDDANPTRFVVAFARHYMRGRAVTMLPQVRLRNIRHCVETIVQEDIPGDVLEAGVWRGGGSIYLRACLEALGGGDRVSFVADSFEGLPEPDPAHPREFEFFHSRMMQTQYAKMAASQDEVEANFHAYGLMSERIRFLVGWFKDTLPSAPIERLSLLRLDGDYYDSTMDSLTALYAKLSPGGFAIIDDYGEELWTDCRQAVEDFRGAHGIDEPIVKVDSKCVYWRKAG